MPLPFIRFVVMIFAEKDILQVRINIILQTILSVMQFLEQKIWTMAGFMKTWFV